MYSNSFSWYFTTYTPLLRIITPLTQLKNCSTIADKPIFDPTGAKLWLRIIKTIILRKYRSLTTYICKNSVVLFLFWLEIQSALANRDTEGTDDNRSKCRIPDMLISILWLSLAYSFMSIITKKRNLIS